MIKVSIIFQRFTHDSFLFDFLYLFVKLIKNCFLNTIQYSMNTLNNQVFLLYTMVYNILLMLVPTRECPKTNY